MSGVEAPAAVLVHTHAGHAPTFSGLWSSITEANLGHVVDDALLTACREAPDSPATAARVSTVLETARSMAPIVGVTCVLVGEVAARHGLDDDGVSWINDAAASAATALKADRYLLIEAVTGAGSAFADSLSQAGVDRSRIEIELHEEVWPGLAEEDPSSYSRLAEVATERYSSEVAVVLTQASMAPVVGLLSPAVASRVIATPMPLVEHLAATVG